MDQMMVEAAQQASVAEVGRSAAAPGYPVMGLGPGWWAITPREDASLVPDRQREALVSVEQPLAPAQIQHGRVRAEDGGDEARVARQPADFAGGDAGAG